MLVRHPVDGKRFSGRVIVELLDVAEGHDVAPLWGLSYQQFLRNGDVWVGVTTTPVAMAALQKFDSIRYAPVAAAQPEVECAGDSGLAWDLIAQAGALLRSTSHENPLRNYNPHRVILAGFGLGGSQVITFANALHAGLRLGDSAPIYDGYLSAAAPVAAPINTCATALPAGDPRLVLQPRDVPVVAVWTQTELRRAPEARREDSDKAGALYRQYEIAGAAHSGPYPAGQPADVDLQIAGMAAAADGDCRELRSDFPLGLAFNAIWQQLDGLMVRGEAMISVPRIEIDARGDAVADRQGNAQGGWRLPQIDVPLASYAGHSTPERSNARAVCESTGSMRRFDTARLKALYKDRNEYIKRFDAAVDQAVADGRLVKEDAAALKTPAVRTLPAF
jgi:hypothetical protein